MFTVFDAVDFLPKQIMGFLRVAPPWIAPGDPPVVLPSDGHFPSWMPDGRIIFVSGRRDGSSQIWLMNAADGSGAIQLGNLSPSMNPKLPQMALDGTVIFQGNDPTLTLPDSNAGIYTMKPDGSSLRQVAQGMGPSIALDGTWFSFTYQTDPPNFHRQVWRASIDGSNKTALTTNADPTWPDHAAPIISPDGTMIACFHGKEANWNDPNQSIFTFGHRDIAIIPANGGPPKKLTSTVPVTTQPELEASVHAIVADDPCWTPDSQWLIYNAIFRLGNQTRMVDINGAQEDQYYKDLVQAPMRVQLKAA
jgi:Tol biopolymer transport system component